MGKKKSFGINSKKEEARLKKLDKKKSDKAAKAKATEDAKWVETDKHSLKKKAKAQKQADKLREKDRNADLKRQQLEQEEKEMQKKSKKGKDKVTSHQARAARMRYIASLQAKLASKTGKDVKPVNNMPLVKNTNHDEKMVGGENIDDALAYFDAEDKEGKIDRHPEKRRKAAWMKYQETRFAEIKAEFPTLKRSQINERIFKEWQKSPENPMNQ